MVRSGRGQPAGLKQGSLLHFLTVLRCRLLAAEEAHHQLQSKDVTPGPERADDPFGFIQAPPGPSALGLPPPHAYLG